MKKTASKRLTAKQTAELAALAQLPENRINTRETPEVRDWSGAKRGLFFRPVKQQLTLRLDADVLNWFKTNAPNGEGYQTDINQALREHMRRKERPRKRA